jgi:hypothetical protein
LLTRQNLAEMMQSHAARLALRTALNSDGAQQIRGARRFLYTNP